MIAGIFIRGGYVSDKVKNTVYDPLTWFSGPWYSILNFEPLSEGKEIIDYDFYRLSLIYEGLWMRILLICLLLLSHPRKHRNDYFTNKKKDEEKETSL